MFHSIFSKLNYFDPVYLQNILLDKLKGNHYCKRNFIIKKKIKINKNIYFNFIQDNNINF
jgi:hypothetical protein